MQFKILLIGAVLGIAAAQRGHYAGSGNIRQSQTSQAQPAPAQAQPVQSNFVAPTGGSQTDNRFDGYNGVVAPVYQHQNPIGFGQGFGPGYGFAHPNQGFPFSPYGFNGR